MDLRRTINDFVYECKYLGTRLQSKDQGSLTEVDLVMLRTQLFLLDTAASNLLERDFKENSPPRLNLRRNALTIARFFGNLCKQVGLRQSHIGTGDPATLWAEEMRQL